MTKTVRTLYALAAVVILGTVVYAQDKPKTGEKNALPSAQQDNGNLVRSLNTLQGNVTLQAGSNISITPSGNSLTITATNALTAVAHDNTLTGNGTAASPLRVAGSSQDTAVDAFWESQSQNFGGSSPLLSFSMITVPAGKQLIVQHVSIGCTVAATDELTAHIAVAGKFHFLDLRRGSGPTNIFRASQPITLYLNPGAELVVEASKSTFSSVGSCHVAVSGRFVPVP